MGHLLSLPCIHRLRSAVRFFGVEKKYFENFFEKIKTKKQILFGGSVLGVIQSIGSDLKFKIVPVLASISYSYSMLPTVKSSS